MKYVIFNIEAENKHSKGDKVPRPIMFEVHGISDSGFIFRFRDMKLKHCTSSVSVNTEFNILNNNGELNPESVAEFLSVFLKHYYTFATWFNEKNGKKPIQNYNEYGLGSIVDSDFIDKSPMCQFKLQMDDNSISPTVVKGIISALDGYLNGTCSPTIELGEKIKSVQKNRLVLEFLYDYMPVMATVNA